MQIEKRERGKTRFFQKKNKQQQQQQGEEGELLSSDH